MILQASQTGSILATKNQNQSSLVTKTTYLKMSVILRQKKGPSWRMSEAVMVIMSILMRFFFSSSWSRLAFRRRLRDEDSELSSSLATLRGNFAIIFWR